MARGGRLRGGAVIAGFAFVGVAAAALYWGPGLYEEHGDKVVADRCTVTTPEGATYGLTAPQANNAALIAGVGFQSGFAENGVTVAIATAIQESSLYNLDYGDRDSVGLFQQRPSQGWGTVEEIMDPYYSARKFYAALSAVAGWETMPVTEAAQAVQRSGFPDAYADHEDEARAWAHAFTGLGGTVTCEIVGGEAGTAAALTERVAADLGEGYTVEVLESASGATIVGITPVADTPGQLSRVQAWAIATASSTGALWVDREGSLWERDGTWTLATPTPEWLAYRGVRVGFTPSPR